MTWKWCHTLLFENILNEYCLVSRSGWDQILVFGGAITNSGITPAFGVFDNEITKLEVDLKFVLFYLHFAEKNDLTDINIYFVFFLNFQ